MSLQGCIHQYDITNAINSIFDSANNLFVKHKLALESITSNFQINDHSDIQKYGVQKLTSAVERCLNPLKQSPNTHLTMKENVIKAYLKMAYFAQKNGESFNYLFICSVLWTMKFGSLEGMQLFPCILSMDNLGTTHKDVFTSGVTLNIIFIYKLALNLKVISGCRDSSLDVFEVDSTAASKCGYK